MSGLSKSEHREMMWYSSVFLLIIGLFSAGCTHLFHVRILSQESFEELPAVVASATVREVDAGAFSASYEAEVWFLADLDGERILTKKYSVNSDGPRFYTEKEAAEYLREYQVGKPLRVFVDPNDIEVIVRELETDDPFVLYTVIGLLVAALGVFGSLFSRKIVDLLVPDGNVDVAQETDLSERKAVPHHLEINQQTLIGVISGVSGFVGLWLVISKKGFATELDDVLIFLFGICIGIGVLWANYVPVRPGRGRLKDALQDGMDLFQ